MTNNRDLFSCKAGEERYEWFYSANLKAYRLQYDYRALDGELFSCIALSPDDARVKRDAWIAKRDQRTSAT